MSKDLRDTNEIRTLQEMLRVLEPESGPFENGVFGKNTQLAVERFQQSHGMKVTGIVDAQTRQALQTAYDREIVSLQAASPLEIVMQPHQVLERGCSNTNVFLVQAMIRALDNYIPALPVVDVNGKLDNKTEHAIKWLQACFDLPQSGAVDKNTWRFLVHMYRSMVGDGTGAFPVRYRTQTS